MEDPDLLENEEIQIFVDELGSGSVILGMRAWVATSAFWTTKWRMNEKIKQAFDENEIQIPYPQMDVHIRKI